MQTVVDDELRREAALYRLRFGCEDCAHFDLDRSTCAEGFPNGPHVAVSLRKSSLLEFCKSFELA
jgi:hypothetical protein